LKQVKAKLIEESESSKIAFELEIKELREKIDNLDLEKSRKVLESETIINDLKEELSKKSEEVSLLQNEINTLKQNITKIESHNLTLNNQKSEEIAELVSFLFLNCF
jgi:hypothetical protein